MPCKPYHLDPSFASVALARSRDESVYVVYSVPLTSPEYSLDSTVDATAINAVTHPWFTEKAVHIRPVGRECRGRESVHGTDV
jgi:hypothetical protein